MNPAPTPTALDVVTISVNHEGSSYNLYGAKNGDDIYIFSTMDYAPTAPLTPRIENQDVLSCDMGLLGQVSADDLGVKMIDWTQDDLDNYKISGTNYTFASSNVHIVDGYFKITSCEPPAGIMQHAKLEGHLIMESTNGNSAVLNFKGDTEVDYAWVQTELLTYVP